MESNALEKSTNNSVASRFFARTPRIQRIVNIGDVGDRFFPKAIFILLKYFLNCGFYAVAAIDVRVITR